MNKTALLKRASLPAELRDLVAMSRDVGADAALVQGGGGNTSVKNDAGDRMWVKASGTALGEMSAQAGWRELDLRRVKYDLYDPALLRAESAVREKAVVAYLLENCVDGLESGARPSVESHVHAQLGKAVVHVHAAAVGGLVHAAKGEAVIMGLLEKLGLDALWLPYSDPGFSLGMKLAAALAKRSRVPDVVVQGKHGVFVSAPSAAKAVATLRRIVRACAAAAPLPSPVKGGAIREKEAKETIRRFEDEAKKWFKEDVEVAWRGDALVRSALTAPSALFRGEGLSPDDLVYTHGRLRRLEAFDLAKIRVEWAGSAPGGKPTRLFLVRDLGLFAVTPRGKSRAALETAAMVLEARLRAATHGGPVALTPRERHFILHWEAETYRASTLGPRRVA